MSTTLNKRLGYEIGIGSAHGAMEHELACGRGSYPKFNQEYCENLLQKIKDLNITSVSDYGCGNMETYKDYIDWNLNNIDYNGYDVHVGCIEENKKRYPQYKFFTMELNSFPPENQALIIKDVLIHWFDEEIEWFFNNVFKNFRYVFYMHSTTERGYKTWKHRHAPYKGYEIDQLCDKNLYGYKCVPHTTFPEDKIIFEKNIMADTMKTFIVFDRDATK